MFFVHDPRLTPLSAQQHGTPLPFCCDLGLPFLSVSAEPVISDSLCCQGAHTEPVFHALSPFLVSCPQLQPVCPTPCMHPHCLQALLSGRRSARPHAMRAKAGCAGVQSDAVHQTDLGTNLGGVSAQGLQHACSDALALTQQAQKDVLSANVVVACMQAGYNKTLTIIIPPSSLGNSCLAEQSIVSNDNTGRGLEKGSAVSA